jgi:hypothetical protein
MDRREYWSKELRESEAGAAAAKRRTVPDAAAKRLNGERASQLVLEQTDEGWRVAA